MSVLTIKNLKKSFGPIQALDDLSIDLLEGQILGILGPNGSGKTTTLGIILGIIQQDSGSFTWFDGQFSDRFQLKIGALLETPNFYPYMNAIQNLEVIRQIKMVEKMDFEEILTLVNLWERRTSRFSTYSLGMKQRLAIAATLIGNPDVLIFDEPTNGLDPKGIAEVRNVLTHLASTGKTILMASHILDEVEKVCTHVAILKKGALLAFGKVGSILSNDLTVEVAALDMDGLEKFVDQQPLVKDVEKHPHHLELQVDRGTSPEIINKICYDAGFVLTHLVFRKRRLEDEFLAITEK